MLATNCKAQQEADHGLREEKTGFVWDVSFYPDDNNVAKSAVILEDGFIIAGQKFTKQDTVLSTSAIIKLNPEGKLIRETFQGSNAKGDEKKSRIESILQLDHNRILCIGSKGQKLWLRLINTALDVIRDTVISAVPVRGLYPPECGLTHDGFYIVTDPVGIIFADKDFSTFEYTPLRLKGDSLDIAECILADAAFDEPGGRFYITGSICAKRDGLVCLDSKQILMVYDVPSGTMAGQSFLDEFSHVRCIALDQDRVYIAGECDPLHPETATGKPVKHDVLARAYTLRGVPLTPFRFETPDGDLVYDLSVKDQKLYLAGEFFDKPNIIFKSFYAVFDLQGKLTDKKVFFTDPILNRENRILKVCHTPDGKKLLLGKGRGWRILLLK